MNRVRNAALACVIPLGGSVAGRSEWPLVRCELLDNVLQVELIDAIDRRALERRGFPVHAGLSHRMEDRWAPLAGGLWYSY